MKKTNQVSSDNNKSVLLNIEKISHSVQQNDIQILVNAIDKEVGNRKLNKSEIEQLQTIMSVDALEAARWKSVADVLKYISIFALAENNPQVLKRIAEVLLGIVGLFYPIANTAQGILTKVPMTLFSTLIKIGGLASPDYLIYRGVNAIANKRSEKAIAKAEQAANTYEDMTALIIVCKNKLLSAEMDKLIQLKDGNVHTIIWNEAAWKAFNDKLTENDRVLIIGKIKDTIPLTQDKIRFEKFGVKYGWNNNVAKIEADGNALKSSKKYNEFLSDMETLQISEKLKKNAKFKFDWATVGKLAIFPPLLLGDVIHEGTAIREQQLLFGIYSLYTNHLNEFLTPISK